MRCATLLLVGVVALSACNDLRSFAGQWRGGRVGDSPVVKVGIEDGALADLAIDDIDTHGLHGRISISGASPLITDRELSSLPGAEADALASMSFSGSPKRVYLSFVTTEDGGGDVLAMIGLYNEHRIDLRLLRGGAAPIYAIFDLSPFDG